MKKLLLTAGFVATAGASFIFGKSKAEIPINYVNVEEIVDWNTDGRELAIMDTNGIELYAYKSDNVYGPFKSYIACDEIVDWKETKDGIALCLRDGNVYNWKRK